MRNINEENKPIKELAPRHPQEENPTPKSDLSARPKDEENPRPDEKQSVEEDNQIRSKDDHSSQGPASKKKEYNPEKVSHVSHAVSASLASVAIILVVASVLIIGKDFFKTAPSYAVNSVSFVDSANANGIAYDVTVSKNPDKVPLTLKSVYADSLGRIKDSAAIDITEAKAYSGILPSMKYFNVNYVLEIVRTDHNSEQVLWKNAATFSRNKETKFYGFFWECHCTESAQTAGEAAGKAYYQLTYLDDFDYWSSFKVRLTKTTDASVSYTFACAEPYSERHLVDTLSKEGGTYLAEVIATSSRSSPSAEETVYSHTVSI
jgi:hypothetical protein